MLPMYRAYANYVMIESSFLAILCFLEEKDIQHVASLS